MNFRTASLVTALVASLVANLRSPAPQIGGDVREFLSHVRMVDMPDGYGGMVRTVRIEGLNVQIVNGLGRTEGVNASGNLIIGYAENPLNNPPMRVGSHNLIVGPGHNYGPAAYGGVIFGVENTLLGPSGSVTGGHLNRAACHYSSITGGSENATAANGAVVSGGHGNTAIGGDTWVGGGEHNVAAGASSAIVGGANNRADGPLSTVSGGTANDATGSGSSVSGGFNRSAISFDDWVAGSLFEDQ